jgi:hypothetical protein
MIKLHDTMDRNSKNKEDEDPGFTRLEQHRKKLILHDFAVPPFDTEVSSPTEFYLFFLAKKSQLMAKDMLVHRFHIDKIAFNPNTTFVMNLWNSEFFWSLPDSPSGVSSCLFNCIAAYTASGSQSTKTPFWTHYLGIFTYHQLTYPPCLHLIFLNRHRLV